jgi:hypothetical protein
VNLMQKYRKIYIVVDGRADIADDFVLALANKPNGTRIRCSLPEGYGSGEQQGRVLARTKVKSDKVRRYIPLVVCTGSETEIPKRGDLLVEISCDTAKLSPKKRFRLQQVRSRLMPARHDTLRFRYRSNVDDHRRNTKIAVNQLLANLDRYAWA